MQPFNKQFNFTASTPNLRELFAGAAGICICRFPEKEPQTFVLPHADVPLSASCFIVQPWGAAAPYKLVAFDENIEVAQKTDNEDIVLPTTTSFGDYKNQFATLQKAFATGDMHKAVLSRIKQVDKPDGFDPLHFFAQLDAAYPNALVYLLQLPGVGLWAGASPEVLLAGAQGSWKTHSLAGTQVANDVGQYMWGHKEREEQAMVSKHIERTLLEAGAQRLHTDGPGTAAAGHVVHLLTTFAFNLKDGLPELLQKLHPTPAVAGLPVPKAVALINTLEKHQRSLYTGYLGMANLQQGSANLYVNLRCAQIGFKKLALYVGGGITAQSELESEWNETSQKALTLEKIIYRNA